MWRILASTLFFLFLASIVLACEAVTHANDYGTASTAADSCGTGTLFCNGSCVPQSPTNCSACGVGCAAGQVCSDGTCGSGCSANLTQCGSNCVDTQADPHNCGQCGGPTDGGACPFCQKGVCQSQCASPSAVCGDLCVDLTADQDNCGSCGNKCRGDAPLCDHSKCVASCGSETACNGACTDFTNDPQNCGGCHTSLDDPFKCASPANTATGVAACVDGTCKIACNLGLTYCTETLKTATVPVCVDLTTNPNHCGSCTVTCPSGALETCVAGKCTQG